VQAGGLKLALSDITRIFLAGWAYVAAAQAFWASVCSVCGLHTSLGLSVSRLKQG